MLSEIQLQEILAVDARTRSLVIRKSALELLANLDRIPIPGEEGFRRSVEVDQPFRSDDEPTQNAAEAIIEDLPLRRRERGTPNKQALAACVPSVNTPLHRIFTPSFESHACSGNA